MHAEVDLYAYIIEPYELRRRLICETVVATPGLRVMGAAGSLADADPPALAESDLFLVNASLLSSELQALQTTSRLCPNATFILFASHPDVDALLSVSDLPVRGFLSFSHLTREEFKHDLGVIACGGAVIEPLTARLLLEHLGGISSSRRPDPSPLPSGLTTREEEVLVLVRKGLSNKEIAMHMGISFGTVRAHLRNIFRKLDVTSRAGAAVSSLEAAGMVPWLSRAMH